MLLAKKISQSNAVEVEQLFDGKIKFLIGEDGKPEEVLFLKGDHAGIKVKATAYGLQVDHIAFVNTFNPAKD